MNVLNSCNSNFLNNFLKELCIWISAGNFEKRKKRSVFRRTTFGAVIFLLAPLTSCRAKKWLLRDGVKIFLLTCLLCTLGIVMAICLRRVFMNSGCVLLMARRNRHADYLCHKLLHSWLPTIGEVLLHYFLFTCRNFNWLIIYCQRLHCLPGEL